jgi:hypothetical protein
VTSYLYLVGFEVSQTCVLLTDIEFVLLIMRFDGKAATMSARHMKERGWAGSSHSLT